MRDGITYRGSRNIGGPSLEEPDGIEDEIDAELESLANTPDALKLEEDDA